MDGKTCRDSLVIRTSRIFPDAVNDHNTLFGGRLMSDIDMTASIAAVRHTRTAVVTASTDSVDFLSPIRPGHSMCLESYVSWTGRTSVEVFTKVIAEDLKTGERTVAATAFLTFVALDDDGRPAPVPPVVPESVEEVFLNETGDLRAEQRRDHRRQSQDLARVLTADRPW